MASQATNEEQRRADEEAFNSWLKGQQSGGKRDLFGKKSKKYVGEQKKQEWWDSRNAPYREAQAQGALEGKATGPILSGSAEEQRGQIAGMNLGNLIYGQGLGQAGQDIQRLKGQLEARSSQSDPISEAIRNQRSGAVARAQRSLAASGVKGGAAAGATEDIARKQDADIAASLYGQQRQSIADERNMVSNIISGQTGLMFGEKAAGAQQPQLPQSGGMFGTVICTELYRQGYMDLATYAKDADYGRYIEAEYPHVMEGYQFLATPIVSLMQKSKLFTKIVSYPALKWARHIAGEENSVIGCLAINVGQPICGVVGKLIMKLNGVKYV